MSQFTVDIDTGGTFTDGFFTQGGKYETVKVDTTPHDLTVCFNQCIAEGARRFGFENVGDFLLQTKTIRLSTTVGTNSLIQRTGPKLGLIVTEGFDRSLYQEKNPVLNFLVEPELVVGIRGKVAEDGSISVEVDEDEVRSATKKLLDAGARAFVVSLKNAHLNTDNERKVRDIIQTDFPTHYLGAKSVLLAGEISLRADDGIRTNAAIVNAYLHRDMVKYLYKADEGIRQQGLTNPLLIAHSNGGVARVAKTKAIDTYNSGPAAGLMGTQYVGQQYGIDNILTLDVGGTSTDVGLIYNGKMTFDTASSIAKVPVHTPLIHVLSVGGGGGSIAKVTKEGKVQVGPESAGAVPGPACFNLGGSKPTVTDAAVILGLIDPEFFLGGKKKLHAQKSHDAIQRSIAAPLHISVREAAGLIIDELTTIGSEALKSLAAERGYTPENFVLFSFGGGGGLFCADMAQKCGIKRIYTFPFSSVFSAFGLSTADINHVYETRSRFQIRANEDSADPALHSELSEKLGIMKNWAYRDMRGEGFSQEEVCFDIEVEVTTADGKKRGIYPLPFSTVETQANAKEINEYLQGLCRTWKASELIVEFIRLRAQAPVSHYRLPEAAMSDSNPLPAQKGFRSIGMGTDQFEARIYDLSLLKPGNEIAGPAIIESNDTTIFIPPNAGYRMDQHLNGILEV
ncbi:hydantoinase/oxoprolinase family protein [Paenibacillus validus]|uniref:hydantoinase/oxoprolinase family protein n=1 Tax=Paenibacillus TaxID=44249 RepID=UPI000FD9C193|nr:MULTISPECIES: hydantoinase/oxoprolinase family protein [Paenibacillus]MED4600550.1 hydantoinase/oxoprolinase family protein [Paenibacillus validus]MED4606569.1 hydantoinase/oxoprolinase family protein [Paenibacillus validus]